MSKKYYIQILDGETNQIVYFDRMKTYRSTHRVITSSLSGKSYLSRQVAELEVELIRQYYHGELIIEIVERKFTEQKSDEDFIF